MVSKKITNDKENSNRKNIFEGGFAERLKEERRRLGLSQEEFGRLGGVGKLAQFHYEKGTRSPSIDYLYALEDSGADINVIYILTGGVFNELSVKDGDAKEEQQETLINAELLADCLNTINRFADGCVIPVSATDLSTLSSALYRTIVSDQNLSQDAVDKMASQLFTGWILGRANAK